MNGWVGRLRRLGLVALMLPLLATGTCAQIGIEAVLTGFFDVTNALLVDYAEERVFDDSGDSGRTP